MVFQKKYKYNLQNGVVFCYVVSETIQLSIIFLKLIINLCNSAFICTVYVFLHNVITFVFFFRLKKPI